jgi:methylamine---glutamate N-methyltransferase subunit B
MTDDSELTLDCDVISVRDVHRLIRSVMVDGKVTRVRLINPKARHNLGVAMPEGLHLTIDGPAGYYAAGLNDGSTLEVKGGAGWGVAESMRDGLVVVNGDAGNAAAASIRSGTVIVRGNASTRAGIAMKGGTLVVGGNVGPSAGFMMQKGRIIVCGDAADGVADSMYEGTIYVGGQVGSPGSDVVEEQVSELERDEIFALLDSWKLAAPSSFRKLVSGRALWNFQKADLHLWKAAL